MIEGIEHAAAGLVKVLGYRSSSRKRRGPSERRLRCWDNIPIAVLREIGFDAGQIARMRADGAI